MINNKVIAIDARMIEMSGIGTYIQNLLRYGIYDYAIGDHSIIRKYDSKIRIISFTASIYGLKEQFFFPNNKCKLAGIDIIHFPHYNVPFIYRGDYIVTIHDLTHILFPELLGSRIKYIYAKMLLKHASTKAKHILTDSINSKNDIAKELLVDTKHISVTYCGVNEEFFEKKKEAVSYLYEKYLIPQNKKILLYVGNLKVHKNLINLLKAFSKIDNRSEYILILAGKAFDSLSLVDTEKELGICDSIIHTGIIEKSELIDLYNLADLFVFPSLYEGFGLPPLEAMACGTPVVCSNTSSLPEVVGNAAIMFDPTDIEEMKNTIIDTLNNNVVLQKLKRLGKEQCKKFTWDNTAEYVKNEIDKLTTFKH